MCFVSPPAGVSLFNPSASAEEVKRSKEWARTGKDPNKVHVVESTPEAVAKADAFKLLKDTPDFTSKMVREAAMSTARNAGNAQRNRANSFLSGPDGSMKNLPVFGSEVMGPPPFKADITMSAATSDRQRPPKPGEKPSPEWLARVKRMGF